MNDDRPAGTQHRTLTFQHHNAGHANTAQDLTHNALGPRLNEVSQRMPGLVLELKQDELIIINGAVIKFRAKSRIEINGKARFLFGKQVLLPHDSTTPARRIYLSLQTAYVGNEDERQSALAEAKTLIAAFRTQTISPATKEMLDRMVSFAEAGESYEALKLARSIIRFEDGLTAQPVVSAGTDRPTEGSAHPPPVQSL